MFARDDFHYACVWPLPKRGYRLGGGVIEPVGDSEWKPTSPLEDPDLFVSFARLGARGIPSEKRVLRWVNKYGLLKRQDERQGPFIVRRYFVEKRTLNQAPASLAEFRAEVRDARGALELYDILKRRDADAMRAKISGFEGQLERHSLPRVYRSLVRTTGETFALDRTDRAIRKASWNLQEFVKQKVAPVRLDISGWGLEPVSDSSYAPVQSWECPDLLSAIYLQFYLWMVGAWPMRICANPRCSTPFAANRTDKEYCTDACRSAARKKK